MFTKGPSADKTAARSHTPQEHGSVFPGALETADQHEAPSRHGPLGLRRDRRALAPTLAAGSLHRPATLSE